MQDSVPSVPMQQIVPSYDFRPFGDLLRPLIQKALIELKKDRFRKGTTLIPVFLVWVMFALTIRRDLNTQALIGWMVSAARWIDLNLAMTLLSDGALSHARVALGFEIFELIFKKLGASVELSPDFHGLVTVIFDGTSMTHLTPKRIGRSLANPVLAREKRAIRNCEWSACWLPRRT